MLRPPCSKSLTREITLSIQARYGASVAVVVWRAVMTLALLTGRRLRLVRGAIRQRLRRPDHDRDLRLDRNRRSLTSALVRRRVRERTILARAAKMHTPAWLLDPRILATAVEAGRSIGWQRIVPVALARTPRS